MADAKEFVQAMKSAAVEAMKATKPVNVYFGEVQSVNPLKINVEQKMLLGEGQLILTRNVTDFDTTVTMNRESQQITIHNSLKAGNSVILVRQQEGQKFIVLDRIGGKQ